MHRLNGSSGGNSLFTQYFAWLSAFATALGLSMQEVVYLIFGVLGLIISLGSFLCGRWDARRLRQEEVKRTQLLSRYVAEVLNRWHRNEK